MSSRFASIAVVILIATTSSTEAFAQGRGNAGGRGLSQAAGRAAAASSSGLNSATQAAQSASTGAYKPGSASIPSNTAVAGSVGEHAKSAQNATYGQQMRSMPRNFTQAGVGAASVPRNAHGMQGTQSGTQPADAVTGTVAVGGARHDAPVEKKNVVKSTWDRIFLKRNQQADHLRSISERNGNEALQQTADRMNDVAIRNYERAVPPITQQADLPLGSQDIPLTTDNSQLSGPGETVAQGRRSAIAPEGATTDNHLHRIPATPATAKKRGFWFRSQ